MGKSKKISHKDREQVKKRTEEEIKSLIVRAKEEAPARAPDTQAQDVCQARAHYQLLYGVLDALCRVATAQGCGRDSLALAIRLGVAGLWSRGVLFYPLRSVLVLGAEPGELSARALAANRDDGG